VEFWFRSSCVSRLWNLSGLLEIWWEDGNSSANHCVRIAVSRSWFMQVSSDTYCPKFLIWFFQIPWCTPTSTYILLRLEVMRFLCKSFLKQLSSQITMPVSSVLVSICDVLPFNRSHPSSLSYGVSILRLVSLQVTRGGITTNHGVGCIISFCTNSYNFWQLYVFPPQLFVHF